MKTELLSPAGDMESLKYAIHAGADAVYLAGKKFGARAFAQNFTNEELIEAINYCHLYGVKIYVTLNTIVFESEIEYFLENVNFLYENGVDAVIVQDIGMISLIRKYFKDLDIHVSTQMHTINNYGVKLLKEMNIQRVVLAREMSLEEIKNIDKDIETEVFIHGALCASYSGRCLFSSLNGGRSGNRGACVGSCRLPYEVVNHDSGPFPLSTKDLCSLYNLKELLDAKITSFKIEGRMKNKEYVFYVTKIYRKLIDNYYQGLDMTVSKEDVLKLKLLFNRNFTKGYLFNENIYYDKSSNHIGVNIGNVIKITTNKIFIKLNSDLSREDGIRFTTSGKGMIVNKLYNEKGLLCEKCFKNEIASVDNKIKLSSYDAVNKTLSIELLNEIKNFKEKKIEISFNVIAKDNLIIEISDGINKIKENFGSLEKAIKKSTSKEEIISKLNKLGNTPFTLKNINIELDNVFIPMKLLNEARRILCEKLINKRIKKRKRINFNFQKTKYKNEVKRSILVSNEKELKNAIDKYDTIYVTDFNLYKKYKNEKTYYKVPRINYENLSFENENLLVSDIGALYKFKNNNIITDYTFNITNSESVKTLLNLGAKRVTLSLETPSKQIKEIIKYAPSIEVVISCIPELMELKTFPYENGFLKDRFGNLFPIVKNDYISILHFKRLTLNEEFNCFMRIEKH